MFGCWHGIRLEELFHDLGRVLVGDLVHVLHVNDGHRVEGLLLGCRWVRWLHIELKVQRGGTGRKLAHWQVPTALGQAKAILLASPVLGQIGEPGQEGLPPVRVEPGDEVGALAENVEQVEDTQDHLHVTRRQQRRQVLHGVVQVPGEAVFNQQGSELQDAQQQLFLLLAAGAVAVQAPLALLARVAGRLKQRVKQVQHIDPVVQLTLAPVPAPDGLQLLEQLLLGAALEALHEEPAVQRHLRGALLQPATLDLHGAAAGMPLTHSSLRHDAPLPPLAKE